MQETYERIGKWFEKFKADCWKRWYLFPIAVLVAVMENRIMDLLNQLVDKIPFAQIWSAIESVGNLHVVNRSIAALAFVVSILLIHSYWETRPRRRIARDNLTTPRNHTETIKGPSATTTSSRAVVGVDPPLVPPKELTRQECRLEWSPKSTDAVLYFYVWNGTPNEEVRCSVTLIGVRRWSHSQKSFIKDRSILLSNFTIISRPIWPEDDSIKHEIVIRAGAGCQILSIKRDLVHYISQIGLWDLELVVTFGSRSLTEHLTFKWDGKNLSPAEPSAAENL